MRCWMPTDRSPTSTSGSISNPSWRARSRIRPSAFLVSRKTGFAMVSLPRTMFSATEKTGTSMKCWWTIPMPRAIASDGPAMAVGTPSSRISPESGESSPYRMFIRVLLPAPFSPRRAWISPGLMSRSMPSLATTPGKRLVMPRISRLGAAAAATSGSIVMPPLARSAAASAGPGWAAVIEPSGFGSGTGGTSATGASRRCLGQRRINESGGVPEDPAARSRVLGRAVTWAAGRRRRSS